MYEKKEQKKSEYLAFPAKNGLAFKVIVNIQDVIAEEETNYHPNLDKIPQMKKA